jgi:hypothetical protein
MTGGVVPAVLTLWERLRNVTPRWVWIVLPSIFLFVSTFQAWNDEYTRAEAQKPQVQCTNLTELLRVGRALSNQFVTTHGDASVIADVKEWYPKVCSAMSAAQCEAFMSAKPDLMMTAGIPFNVGGTYQALNGHISHLSDLVSKSCP